MEKKMGVVGGKKPVDKNQLTYEQLENVAHQLSEQGRNLKMQNDKLKEAFQEANLVNFYKRLDYLWIIINTKDNKFISEEFQKKCGEEFMLLMASPEEVETEEKDN